MFTEDYVLRQIAQAVAVIAKVLGLSKSGQFQEANMVIDQAIEELLGLDANIIKQMDDRGLISLLTTVQGLDCGKVLVLADLLKVEGDILAAQKRGEESQFNYQRALNLYHKFSTHCSAILETDVTDKIDELQNKLVGDG